MVAGIPKIFADTKKYTLTMGGVGAFPGPRLDTVNLTDYHLVMDILPDRDHSVAEAAAMKAFLDVGGRIIFQGEHSGYSPVQNARISKYMTDNFKTGFTIIPRFLDTQPTKVNGIAVMSGLKALAASRWAPLSVDTDSGAVLATDWAGNIFAADFYVGKGQSYTAI